MWLNGLKEEEHNEYGQISEPAVGALRQQGNAVYFFSGHEIPHLEEALDRKSVV